MFESAGEAEVAFRVHGYELRVPVSGFLRRYALERGVPACGVKYLQPRAVAEHGVAEALDSVAVRGLPVELGVLHVYVREVMVEAVVGVAKEGPDGLGE